MRQVGVRLPGTMMEPELIIAELVREWVQHVRPDDAYAADAAAALAVRCYVGGASVADACTEAREFIGSWSRHPSHAASSSPLAIAS